MRILKQIHIRALVEPMVWRTGSGRAVEIVDIAKSWMDPVSWAETWIYSRAYSVATFSSPGRIAMMAWEEAQSSSGSLGINREETQQKV